MESSGCWMWEDKPADTGTAAVGLFAGPQSCKIACVFYALYGWGQNAGINTFFTMLETAVPDFRKHQICCICSKADHRTKPVQ